MQLKTVEEQVDAIMHTPVKDNFGYDTLNAEQKTFFVKEVRAALTDAITQDRADTRAVLKEGVEKMNHEGVKLEEFSYQWAKEQVLTLIDTLLPGDVSK